MTTIIYEFEIKDFNASDGYARIEVKDGKLEFEAFPDAATLALIKKHDGKLAETQPKPARIKRALAAEIEMSPEAKGKSRAAKENGE